MEDGSSGSGRTHAPRFGVGVDENVISELMDMDPFVDSMSGNPWGEDMELTEMSPSSSGNIFGGPFFSLFSFPPSTTPSQAPHESYEQVQHQSNEKVKVNEQQQRSLVKEEQAYDFCPTTISPWMYGEAFTSKQGQVMNMGDYQQGNAQSFSSNQMRSSDIVSYGISSFQDPYIHVKESPIGELIATKGRELVSKRSSELAAMDIRWNRVNASDNSSFLKERMMQALRYIKESTGRDVLAQVWVPIRKGSKWVLTTSGQPFVIDPASDKLTNFRTVSLNYNFSAEEDSEELPGLPGRVFLRKMPEWTPDVQFYSRKEYPRVVHAQHYDVRGTLALPVFEPDNQSCVGVVELIMMTSKFRYGPEFENICRALQAVNLRSSEILDHPKFQTMGNDRRQAVLPEILEVLTAVCETHKLPLAQTWVPCRHRSLVGSGSFKRGNCLDNDGSSDEQVCMSTVVEACYMTDAKMMAFQEACSEQHLLKGQGVPGKALASNQPYFQTDVTTFNKTDYPLVHYAKMLSLSASVAIRLRSAYTGNEDYVLEFFLPVDCRDLREQQMMLNALSVTMQTVCRSLRILSDRELAEERMLLETNMHIPHGRRDSQNGGQIGENTNLSNNSLEYKRSPPKMSHTEGNEWKHEFLVTSQNEDRKPNVQDSSLQSRPNQLCSYDSTSTSEQKHGELDISQTSIHNITAGSLGEGSFSSPSSHDNANIRRGLEKRRGKVEKNISLAVLQQYFAGSLKDAAKSIGVCPTTLKRICRQHGISRWPSRKISKVNRSLKKLQGVIESVQGVDGSFKIGPFATSSFTPGVIPNLWTTEVKAEDTIANRTTPYSHNEHLSEKPSINYSSLPQSFGVTQTLPAAGIAASLPTMLPYKTTDLDHDQTGPFITQACAISYEGVCLRLEENCSGKLQAAATVLTGSKGIGSPSEIGGASKSSEGSQSSSSSHPLSNDAEVNNVSSVLIGSKSVKDDEHNHGQIEQRTFSLMKRVQSEKKMESKSVAFPTRSSSLRNLDNSLNKVENYISKAKLPTEDSQISSGNHSFTAFQMNKTGIPSEKVANTGKQQANPANVDDSIIITVKATYKEDTIRFKLLPSMRFQELGEEVAKRFQLDPSAVNLRYLDDDSEWVLLTCDDDMYECIDILRYSTARTIKLSVTDVHPNVGSSCGSSGGL